MRKCPVCTDSQLERIRYEGVMIFRCPMCRGTLLEYPKLETIERKMQLGEDELESEASFSVPESETPIRCPKCRDKMSSMPNHKRRLARYQSATVADFQIDGCRYCRLAWLDGGELAKLQLSYQRSVKGQENKQHYVNYDELNPSQKAEFRKTIAASTIGESEAMSQGFIEGLIASLLMVEWFN